MPEWMAALTWGDTIAAIAGALLVGGVLWRIYKPVKKALRALEAFMTAWNGTPAVRDGAGIVIEDAKPGVIATLEILRDQLQNSHQNAEIPNLRDDLDTKASKSDVAAVVEAVEKLAAKVDEHITIAKASDDRQDHTGRIVDEYLPKIQQLLGETDTPPATPPGG